MAKGYISLDVVALHLKNNLLVCPPVFWFLITQKAPLAIIFQYFLKYRWVALDITAPMLVLRTTEKKVLAI